MDIGPGSSVVFVGCHGDADTADLSLNTVYFVRDYFQDKLWGSCPRCGDDNLIALEGPRQYKAYDACAFRPYHGPEVEREAFFSKDRGKIGRFEFYRLSVISGIQPK